MAESSSKEVHTQLTSNEKEMENVVISLDKAGQSSAPSSAPKQRTIDQPRTKKFSPKWWAVVKVGGEHRRRMRAEAKQWRELGLPSDSEDEEEEVAEEPLKRRKRAGESESTLGASVATYSRKKTKTSIASGDHATGSHMTMRPHAQHSTTHAPADKAHDQSPQGQVPNLPLPSPTINTDARASMKRRREKQLEILEVRAVMDEHAKKKKKKKANNEKAKGDHAPALAVDAPSVESLQVLVMRVHKEAAELPTTNPHLWPM